MEIAERLVPPLQSLADSGSAAARSPLVCQQAEVIDGGERRTFRAPGKFTLSAYAIRRARARKRRSSVADQENERSEIGVEDAGRRDPASQY